jgi:hypothetical protein
MPVGTQPATQRMVHLVSGMLRELHVDLLDAEAEYIDARADECFCELGPLFGYRMHTPWRFASASPFCPSF